MSFVLVLFVCLFPFSVDALVSAPVNVPLLMTTLALVSDTFTAEVTVVLFSVVKRLDANFPSNVPPFITTSTLFDIW